MSFLNSIRKKFISAELEHPDTMKQPYGEVDFTHLKPGSVNVSPVGYYDPDLLLIMLKKFIEKQSGVVESVRIATYPCPDSDSPYLMVQNEETGNPGRWFCLAPKTKP